VESEIFKPLLTALPTLLAVIFGGVVTYCSTTKMKMLEFSQARKVEDLKEKKSLYTSFLKITNEATASYYLDKSADNSKYFPLLITDLTRIELFGSKDVFENAKAIVLHITDLLMKASEPDTNLSELTSQFITSVQLELK